jgi:hypothetical protein
MFSKTVILAGTVVVEGVAFRWSVTDGLPQSITVSHPFIGTETQMLAASPDSQAREVGQEMLSRTSGMALPPRSRPRS